MNEWRKSVLNFLCSYLSVIIYNNVFNFYYLFIIPEAVTIDIVQRNKSDMKIYLCIQNDRLKIL